MTKANSLILLVRSLSKVEKKTIYLRSAVTKNTKDYITLFKIIDKQKITDSKKLSETFSNQCPYAAFIPTVKYLYDYILRVLVDIKQNQDKEYELYNNILVSKILLERNLNSDYSSFIQQLQRNAEEQGNYNLLLILRRMELDHILLDGFDGVTEKDLLHKQNKINDTLKILRQINEQSYLYEMLRYRIEKFQYAGSSLKLQAFNDLIISEISLTSNLRNNIFQINKLHQLFQANYLISIGDYKSALNSFSELNKLFINNQKQWNNPPVYYVMVIEGILESLKRIKRYDEMKYYLDNLRQLEHPSVYFQTSLRCIEFIYFAIPYLERNEYAACLPLLEKYKEVLINKIEYLKPQQYLSLSLYIAIIYLMNNKLDLARKQLTHIINSDSYHDIWVFRPIQLINLIIYYKKGDFDYVISGVRSIKRRNKLSNKKLRIESLLFYFFSLDLKYMPPAKRKAISEKFEQDIKSIEFNIEERRMLSVFDFPKWIISHFEK